MPFRYLEQSFVLNNLIKGHSAAVIRYTYSLELLPASAKAYAKFAGATAKRYITYGLHHWEIWNKPNVMSRYAPATDLKSYVALLKSSYKSIKAPYPESVVITGGTAPSGSDDANLTPYDFLKAIYKIGA